MDGFFTDIWGDLLERTTGPLKLRFILQPTVAMWFAVRGGMKDAHDGRPAFLWSVLVTKGSRWHLLRRGLKDIRSVMILAVGLDLIYQFMAQPHVRLIESLFVALVLAILPYVLIRGPVNRVLRRRKLNFDFQSDGASSEANRTAKEGDRYGTRPKGLVQTSGDGDP